MMIKEIYYKNKMYSEIEMGKEEIVPRPGQEHS